MALSSSRCLRVLVLVFVGSPLIVLTGCKTYGPPPETVGYVSIDDYVGLWYEVASNPVFFNKDLVNVTAEYTKRDDGEVDVLNKGHAGFPDGPVDSIKGIARVVDTETNSKLAVRFPSVLWGLVEGDYWIVALDEYYEWAVVTDSRQKTLFVLSRDPVMAREQYDTIVAQLAADGIDVSRLRITGTIVD